MTIFLEMWITLINSIPTNPTINAVVVAIAGIILPAINLLWNKKQQIW